MQTLNYFSVLCFVWALIGIGSRIVMIRLGEKWNTWELEKVYAKEKRIWVYFAGLIAVLLVCLTWYKVYTTDIKFAWVIALLISLTLIKVFTLLFHYEKFRLFAKTVLNDKRKLMQLNVAVAIISAVCIGLGIFLY